MQLSRMHRIWVFVLRALATRPSWYIGSWFRILVSNNAYCGLKYMLVNHFTRTLNVLYHANSDIDVQHHMMPTARAAIPDDPQLRSDLISCDRYDRHLSNIISSMA